MAGAAVAAPSVGRKAAFSAFADTFAKSPLNPELGGQGTAIAQGFARLYAEDAKARQKADHLLDRLLEVEPRFLDMPREQRRSALKGLQRSGDQPTDVPFEHLTDLEGALRRAAEAGYPDPVGTAATPWEYFDKQRKVAALGPKPQVPPPFHQDDWERQEIFQGLKDLLERVATPADPTLGYGLE